jgi:FRG domain
MHSFTINSWEEFKAEFVKKLLTDSSKTSIKAFLFRGQGDSTWKLNSSFDRVESDKSKYPTLISNFEDICKTYEFKDDLVKLGDPKLMAAYAQHYGLPTRLLDWTTSPYFAAFFAFSSNLSQKTPSAKCSVWAINKESEALKRKTGIEFVSPSSTQYNYRMKNQLGHFTLSGHTEDSIEDFDTAIVTSTGIDDLLWKFDIKCTNVRDILNDLEIME